VVRGVVRTVLALGCALFLVACANEYHPDYHPDVRYAYSQSINAPTTVFNSDNQGTPRTPEPVTARSAGGDPSHVLVLETKHLDRPAEVVGVVDAHEEMGKHEAALWTLKTKAARLGADAVVGVEFHHGEGQGEPTHLSGLAVRFVRAVPYPVD
jgi:hypothetical protein